ncbi:MAG: AAA family ATPase, partial [Sulfitobacter sp.]|nr:AAA family ATPase [Sulfitobacter sp.]
TTAYADTLTAISTPGAIIRAPIAMFDLDDTLQYYKDSKLHERAPIICAKLIILAKTHSIVVYSNRKSGNLEPLKRFASLARFPCTVIGATGNDCYRKPHTAGVMEMLKRANLGVDAIEFYCGDAAGRPGDFAASDKALALNLGVKFLTPEEWFYACEPGKYSEGRGPTPYDDYFHRFTGAPFVDEARLQSALVDCAKKRMVIVAGLPCGGKSTFARRLQRYAYEKGGTKFVHISRDPIRGPPDMQEFHAEFDHDKYETEIQMSKRVKQAMLAGHHVVMETNWKVAARFERLLSALPTWFTLVELTTAPWVCHHLNALRARSGERPMLPTVAISAAFKRMERQDTAAHTLHVQLAAAPDGKGGFAADVRVPNFPSFPTFTYA